MNWPALYWVSYSCLGLFVLALSVSCWLQAKKNECRAFWFLLLYVALVALGRWRSIFYPAELNPDESLMLAQAMKFASDLMPWRSIDTGTGGPIDSYVLLMLHWLGLPFGFLLARIAAVACISTYLIFLFLAFRRMSDTRVAALCVTPLAIFHANPVSSDLVHYSSELASMAEIAGICWIISGFSLAERQMQIPRSALVGVFGVFVVFSKLQAVPIAAATTLVLVCLRSASVHQAAVRLCAAALSASALTILMVVVLLHAGVGEDLRVSFIDLPSTYTASPLKFVEVLRFIPMIEDSRDFAFTVTCLICVAAISLLIKQRVKSVVGPVLVPAVLVAYATYVTLSQPGRLFPHYLNYFALGAVIILFVVCRSAYSLSDAQDYYDKSPGNWSVHFAAIALIACAGFLLTQQTLRFVNDPRMPAVPPTDITEGNWVFDALRTLKQPGDRLGIWGWAATIWVYSGLPPATRETSAEFAFRDWGPDHFYRRRYTDTLRQSPPEFFIEAVGPQQLLFKSRESYGMQVIPELAALINSRYIQIMDDGNTRLFIRSDVAQTRLRQIEASAWERAQPVPLTVSLEGPASNSYGLFASFPADVKEHGATTRLDLHNNQALRAILLTFRASPEDRTKLRLGLWNNGVSEKCNPYIRNAPRDKPHMCTITLPEDSKDLTLALTDLGTGSQGGLAIGDCYGVYASFP